MVVELKPALYRKINITATPGKGTGRIKLHSYRIYAIPNGVSINLIRHQSFITQVLKVIGDRYAFKTALFNVNTFLVSSTKVNAVENQDEESFSFVVLGHVRGSDNGEMGILFDELLADVEKLKPDLIFLTGDMIWGDVQHSLHHHQFADEETVKKDWERLDAALKKFDVPVYRVPGNHDIHDPVTRDIYFSRYGKLPQAVTFRNSRFILLNSSFVPEGDQPVPLQLKHTRTKKLAAKQIDFMRKEFSQSKKTYEHVFLFMHHMLWWSEQAPWWQDVHPLLIGKNVHAVFGGDLGPMKFSHMERDGINYIQSSMENLPDQLESGVYWNRADSCLQQFDNFLYVKVNGS